MTLATIALRFLRDRLVASTLTGLCIALGVSLVVASVLLTRGLEHTFVEGTTDYSLVVGAKGSPTQLVLNVVFRIDTPTPNILLPTYTDLARDDRVEVAVPVAMGDAFQGFRYVATSPAYFASLPWRRRIYTMMEGRLFRDDPPGSPSYEAVLGSEAARGTGLRIGDRFYEGEEAAEYPLRVVGVLDATRSADDRAIFISLPSYWGMNEIARNLQVKPLTAVLVRAKRMSDLPALHRQLNVAPTTQAAFPTTILLTIFNLVGLARDVLTLILVMVGIVVVVYLFVSMYSATFERTRELATLRALGAPRTTILHLVVLQSGLIAVVGAAAGVLGGHAVAWGGARLLAVRVGVVTDPFAVGALQPFVFAGVVLVGGLAGLLPALRVCRMEVAENLAPLP
jgi:putative ABC transport system permease protein